MPGFVFPFFISSLLDYSAGQISLTIGSVDLFADNLNNIGYVKGASRMIDSRICVLGSGSYLPGEPVATDQVEEVLGRLDGLNDRLASRLDQFRERLLSRSGVLNRHFAIDPQTRRQTETNASMAEKAARQALEAANMDASEIDLLIFSSPAPDCLTPPTSALLQERLGIERCTEIEIHSNCTGVPKGIQIALDMLRQGRYAKALVTYSQLSSIFLRKEFYNTAHVTLEHLTLRWMLSDGAGALVLGKDGQGPDRPEMLDAYVESVGVGQSPGMTMELGAQPGPDLAHLPTPYIMGIYESGRHHLWQDVSKVAGQAADFALSGLQHMLDACHCDPDDIAVYILPFPGRHFISDKHRDIAHRILGSHIESRMPFLVAEFGYCGGAASLVQFDRMARAGSFKPGDLVVAYVEESSKWMSGGFLVRWE
jgi:3-oxoacyl-[acyl-carrier-protein] synthase III